MNKAFTAFKEYYKFSKAKKGVILAGSLVFYLLLGIVPYFYVAAEICKVLEINFDSFSEILASYVGGDTVKYIIDSSNVNTAGENIIFLALTLYSSATLFYYLKRIGETLYVAERQKSFVMVRIWSIVVMFIIQILIVVFGAVNISINSAIRGKPILKVITFCLTALFIFGALLIINKFVCPTKNKIKDIYAGSLFTTAHWIIFTTGFTFYVKYFANFTRLYGALSFIVIFLIWLYLLMQGLVSGVVINVYKSVKKNLSQN